MLVDYFIGGEVLLETGVVFVESLVGLVVVGDVGHEVVLGGSERS